MMNNDRYGVWISQVAEAPRRPAWLWGVLAGLLGVAVIGGLAGVWLAQGDAAPSAPGELGAIKTALLADDAMVVYVVDNSVDAQPRLAELQEALREVAVEPAENTETALLVFGDAPKLVFGFTEPASAPWDAAIAGLTAQEGASGMFAALQAAQELLPEEPACPMVAGELACRENRITLVSSGYPTDAELAEGTVYQLVQGEVKVDAVALGADAVAPGADMLAFGSDNNDDVLRLIADATGGRFIKGR